MPEFLKILFCSPEALPFVKTGGLADVSEALPRTLSDIGHEVLIFLPGYSTLRFEGTPPEMALEFGVSVGGEEKHASVHEARIPGTDIRVYLVHNEEYFNRPQLYGEWGEDYEDNLRRFSFFCRTVVKAAELLNWRPDIVHCNDWQTALLPLFIKLRRNEKGFWNRTGTMFTIHNLAYQGIFPPEEFSFTGLKEHYFTPETLEFWGKVNLMKSGIVYSDILNTVSRQYSREIQTEEFGFGLDGLLRTRTDELYGVLNGVDYSEWNPEVDRYIKRNYSSHDLSGKEKCKETLRRRCGLDNADVPLIGVISRLTAQKGFDLLEDIADEMTELDFQLVVLGTGEPKYHKLFQRLHEKFPKKISIHLTFDNELAHQIEAGSDMFLMPSRYEPCGLNQMYSLRYGTVPIVRKTGGLADTIVHTTPETLGGGTANGFVFEEYEGEVLLNCLKQALDTYSDRETWNQLMLHGMQMDFSWNQSAREYVRLYHKALEKRSQSH